MALPKLEKDLAIISKLGDNPGSDNGLTASALRAKFDEASIEIQKFLNEELIPELNMSSNPTEGLDMDGPINMNGQKLSGLNDPTENGDAATKGYVDNATAEATEAAKTYTNEQVTKAAPRNLLDNSDFTNPVNQRGKTTYNGSVYSIDRWKMWNSAGNGVLAVKSGYVTVENANLYQYLEKVKENAVYTLAAKYVGESPRVVCGTFAGGASGNGIGIVIANSKYEVHIATGNVEWAALYEGEYTAENLPKYQPKGYGAELAECQRYFCSNLSYGYGPLTSTQSYMAVPIPRRMRVNPTITVLEANEIRCAGKTISVTGVSVNTMRDNCLLLLMSFASTSDVASHAGIWRGRLNASADL